MTDDLAIALSRSSGELLDNLGLRIRTADLVESPPVAAELVDHFERMYGNRAAAERTASAIAWLASGRDRNTEFQAALIRELLGPRSEVIDAELVDDEAAE